MPKKKKWYKQKKFYIIADRGLRGHTTPYYLEIQATKYGTVDVPGFGSLLKIQVSGTSFPYSMMVSTSWVDPSDGKLCKYELPLNMQKTKTGTLI